MYPHVRDRTCDVQLVIVSENEDARDWRPSLGGWKGSSEVCIRLRPKTASRRSLQAPHNNPRPTLRLLPTSLHRSAENVMLDSAYDARCEAKRLTSS